MSRAATTPTRKRRPGVACPHCGGRRSEVLRTTARGVDVRRHRQCSGCGRRFLTTESTAR